MPWDNTLFVSLYNDDMNAAQPVVDFDALAKAGAEVFGLPMMGAVNEGLIVKTNPNYAAQFDAAKATKRMIAGMVKVHPRQDEFNNWNSCETVIETLDLMCGSARLPDFFVLVFEEWSYKDFRGVNPFTPSNLKTAVVQNCELLYKKFHRPVMIEMPWGGMKDHFYDAGQKTNLFVDWLSRQNTTPDNERFPFIGAYYQASNYKITPANVSAWASAIPFPDGTVEANYLKIAGPWRGWELGQIYNNAVGNGKALFRVILLQKKPADLWPYLLEKPYPGTYAGPSDNGNPGGGSTSPDLEKLTERVAALENKLAALKAAL